MHARAPASGRRRRALGTRAGARLKRTGTGESHDKTSQVFPRLEAPPRNKGRNRPGRPHPSSPLLTILLEDYRLARAFFFDFDGAAASRPAPAPPGGAIEQASGGRGLRLLPREKLCDRSNLPGRPFGCFAQIGPVPFSPVPFSPRRRPSYWSVQPVFTNNQSPAYSSILENRGHGLHEESNRSKQSEQRQERQESRHRSTFSVFSVYFVVSHCSGNCREGNVAK